jgi:hypothetical protein
VPPSCTRPVQLVISVADNGPGIEESRLATLNVPYHPDKLIDRRERGSGLGLSILYYLMQAMDGLVNMESSVGTGTKVEVTIPTLAESSDKPAASRMPSRLPSRVLKKRRTGATGSKTNVSGSKTNVSGSKTNVFHTTAREFRVSYSDEVVLALPVSPLVSKRILTASTSPVVVSGMRVLEQVTNTPKHPIHP